MEKAYDPKQVEQRWYQTWVERGYFHASVTGPGSPYAIVIPPPNITGSLHMGHALNNTIQDILIRWRRMQGRNTLWVPGTDHAGIATQNVVEKQLLAEGTTRDKLGRDRFIQRVWEWKAQSGGAIIEQLKRLGSSCDWERLRFTMDEGLSKAVREVFVRLYEDGLLERKERLINWCPRCLTALSDIEVEHEEVKGKLYYLVYPLKDDPSVSLTVATTRPETMLGDTAIAVHPEDPRYNRLIGKRVALPLTHRTIPIVGDSILVDRTFGTGAVKITPSHDFKDAEARERHNLLRMPILDQFARLDPIKLKHGARVEDTVIQELRSLPVAKARWKIEQILRDRGTLIKVEDHKMAIAKCYRCKTIIEPYELPQWFVKIQPLADPAIKAVETGQIHLFPEQWINNYLGWMRDIKDWCISRQIWWGHQIPAWYCKSCHDGGFLIRSTDGQPLIPINAKPVVARTRPSHCPDCGHSDPMIQDPDVLDTWFSSALWPFSTLGWPDETPELKTFYPTSTLVTGFDILFFWVARMIMMGLKFMGEVPFRDVYIHALVRDAEGQKMSKSKGNVIDPLEVMDKYGTDALRFTLAAMASPGRDIKLSEERIEGYRNFANKLWNAARFILMNLDGPRAEALLAERPIADRWIMSRLHRCIGDVNRSLEEYRFDEAANTAYHFIWHEYCDWYLELAKREALEDKDSRAAALTRHTLVESLETILRLLHPFMPFLTEEIWQTLPHTGESVMLAPYPTSDPTLVNQAVEKEMSPILEITLKAREFRGTHGLPPSQAIIVDAWAPDVDVQRALNAHYNLTKRLAHLSALNIMPSTNPVLKVSIRSERGIDSGKEAARIEKRLKELTAQMEQDQKKLSNPDFVAKVPPDVLEKTKKRHEECRLEHENLTKELKRLNEMAGGSA